MTTDMPPADGVWQTTVSVDPRRAINVCGPHDSNLRVLEQLLGINILPRGNELIISGPQAARDLAAHALSELVAVADRGHELDQATVERMVDMVKADERPSEVVAIQVLKGRKTVRPMTVGQKAYVDAIERNTVTFGIGPAGTGKSYLAVAAAVQALQSKKVHRIILTRPAVEAGERLGFLPGDLLSKVDPYLRPLYDALYDMLGNEATLRLMEQATIEVAPLAYMRGRTLNDAFIILDEAQNTTPEQMKMFLTRIGFGSKAVVTGDVTQVDLDVGRSSGLVTVQGILTGVEGIQFVHLKRGDVVRHRIVQDIVDAYERHDLADGGRP
ncbi:MAG: PhoH family protein [Acidimicrobiia bacterium]|nr:PhoH family protein [Acidimicrobiia bacterium]MBP8180020.1 PhoH family protein [Acidimicrobiia bacterium]